MDSAFLTGGTGFVGASLARLLLSRGFRVKALVRKNSDRQNLNGLDLELIEGDLLDKEALRVGCAGARYVFHLAADYRIWVTDPKGMYRANVEGTENVLRAAAKAGAERVVHCSSVAAIKAPADRATADETSEYSGVDEVVSHYKKSKYLSDVLARRLAREDGLPVVIVNPAAPIGPRDAKPTPTGKIVVDFINGRMPSYIDTGMNVVHVDDVAYGHWLAATKGRVGERYILGGQDVRLGDMLAEIARQLGRAPPKLRIPRRLIFPIAYGAEAIAHFTGKEPFVTTTGLKLAKDLMFFSSAKAERELGYRARPYRQAIADAIAWFGQNGYLTN